MVLHTHPGNSPEPLKLPLGLPIQLTSAAVGDDVSVPQTSTKMSERINFL